MNNNFSKITLRYAEALFELAQEKKEQDRIEADMESFYAVCTSNRDFSLMLQNPVIHGDKKRKIIIKIFSDKISDISLRFMMLMIAKNRSHYLPSISGAYTYLYREFKGIKTAYVASAEPLNEEQKNKVLEVLKKVMPHTIEFAESADKSLIGGFVVDVDHYEIDKSLKNQIKELKKKFEENLFVKGF